jgi:predicted nuclease of predicted toxin-antitoxin system
MWLLDVNMPLGLVPVLKDLGMEAYAARSRGWDMLRNGDLIDAASADGFEAILTRDRLFAESATSALRRNSGFSVVVVTLPQLRGAQFIEAFRKAWAKKRIDVTHQR